MTNWRRKMKLKWGFKRTLVIMIIPIMMMAVFYGTAITVVATDSNQPAEQTDGTQPEDTTQQDEGTQPTDGTQPADATQPTGGDTTTDADDSESVEQPEILKDVFGEVVFYRWDRINDSNTPRDAEWHPAMLVWARDEFEIDDGYIGCLAPDCIWLGPEADAVPGATHVFNEDDEIYDDLFDDNDLISEGESCYFRLTDRAEGIDVGSDPQVLTHEKTFFTTDDRDVLYIKYGKTDSDNDNESGGEAPVYMIKLARTPDAPQDYILEPGGQGNDSWIHVHGDEYGYEWTFESYESEFPGDGDDDRMYKVKYNKPHEDDPRLSVGEGQRFMHCRSKDYDWNKYKWFLGKKLRFSAIKGDPTIEEGQILSISASDYVSAEGSPESQNGVILQAGQTITIEKGGILSISGDFINNGTIINNGGVILVENGGSIYPFLQGDDANAMGCGSIKCNGGDIIIESGGAIYSGLNCTLTTDNVKRNAAFWMDNSSTLVNYGLVCCGEMRLGDTATIENRNNARLYACMCEPSWKTIVDQLSDNNQKLMSGDTSELHSLGYFKKEDSDDYYGGIFLINDATNLQNAPSLYVTSGQEDHVNNPCTEWQTNYIDPGLIYYGLLEL